MILIKSVAISVAILLLAASPASAYLTPIPSNFNGNEADISAINSVLAQYTEALSTKNMALFDSLILNKDIPLRSASAGKSTGPAVSSRDYDIFRKAVVDGPAFTQRFQDIHIQQDGTLAAVSLVFINSDAKGTDWGWKSIQLLKTDGQWKIASELFTYHL